MWLKVILGHIHSRLAHADAVPLMSELYNVKFTCIEDQHRLLLNSSEISYLKLVKYTYRFQRVQKSSMKVNGDCSSCITDASYENSTRQNLLLWNRNWS